jgi:hypothetical protein
LAVGLLSALGWPDPVAVGDGVDGPPGTVEGCVGEDEDEAAPLAVPQADNSVAIAVIAIARRRRPSSTRSSRLEIPDHRYG